MERVVVVTHAFLYFVALQINLTYGIGGISFIIGARLMVVEAINGDLDHELALWSLEDGRKLWPGVPHLDA